MNEYIRIFLEHFFVNLVIFMFCVLFVSDGNDEVNNKYIFRDILVCYLLSAGGLYFMFLVIWFIISHGGHLQPLL